MLHVSTLHWVAQTTEMHLLTVVEPRSPISRWWQGWFLLRAFLLGFWLDVLSLCLHLDHSSVHACVLISSYKDTGHMVD